MEEILFPPSPSWFLPNIIASRKDGSVAYGSKNSIVILKSRENSKPDMLIIRNAHTLRITGVAFSPPNCSESIQNTIVSCSDDGFVKLWKIDTLTATIGHKCHSEQKGESGKIISIDWSVANPHYVVSAAENNSLVLWDTLSNSSFKFSFSTLHPTVISCCPYNEKIVAVGGKTGQIYIISLTGSGDVLYKLRGHDNKINSLSWCPIPYNVFKVKDIYEEFLLVSACQNKEVFIWRAGSDGKCECKFQIPMSAFCKRDGLQHGRVGNSFSYVALCWLEPYKIYLSSNFGELIYFDIKSYISNEMSNGAGAVPKPNKQNFIKLAHYLHSKGLFAIAGSSPECEIIVNESISPKSDLRYPIQMKALKVTKQTESNDMAWDVIVLESTSLLWTAGQDRKIIACKMKSPKLEIAFSYNTVNGIVYSVVMSPHDPNKLAIGAGDGIIRLWNLTEPHGDIQVYWQKIKGKVMSLDWHPTKDGLLAYGTSEGRIGLVDTKSNKLPGVFKPGHPLPVYNVCWGPQFPSEDSKKSSNETEFDLYSVGNNTLSLYNPSKLNSDPLNLSKIIAFPCQKQTNVCWKPDYSLMAVGNEDGSICLVEPSQFKIVHTIMAYKKLIHSIAWHPPSTSTDSGLSPYHGYLTSASTDNNHEIRIFNCQKEGNEVKVEQVATLKGHQGQIQCVSWCPHISCRLVSASADGSVQIWDVIYQTSLGNFIPSGLPVFSMWCPIDPDFILTACKNDVLCVWRISTQTKTPPRAIIKTKKTKNNVKNNVQLSVTEELQRGEAEVVAKNTKQNGVSVAETKATVKNSNETKMFLNAWRGSEDDRLKNCYSLLKSEEGRNYSLHFFCDEECFKEAMAAEEESYKNACKWTELSEMALWNGNIKDVLQEKIASGQLNDFLVSLAPVVSPKVWQEACLSYSKTLAEKKFYLKAATYLIACQKIYEALQLLVNADFYLEAIFIARTRLPKLDPMLEKIVKKYAEKLLRTGSLLKACECYLYLGDYVQVAKVCGRSRLPEYLSLAALAAKKCKLFDFETLEATNALFKCFETNNVALAQRICNDHGHLRHLGLLFFVYKTIQQLDKGDVELKSDIISHVREAFNTADVVFPSFIGKLFHKSDSYKNKQQVHAIITQELSFAICADKMSDILTHLIRAISTCHRYDQGSSKEIHPMYKLCRWLSPEGYTSPNSFFAPCDSELSFKVKSLRSYLCASIVTHLHFNEDADVIEYVDLLKELKDDLLDSENYKYFKNLMRLSVCEKEFVEIRSRLSRRVIENEKCSGSRPESDGTVENVRTTDTDIGGEDVLEGALKEKLELMESLKREIENFEEERISSPHPFPVCAWLKQLYTRFPENEAANLLLQDLEEKWFQLN